jgi:tRNA pseudouridine(55) synthase
MQSSSPAGFLLVDKPVDWTSHDVVAYLRRITNIKKIGHAGTLDPFATGLLVVAVSRSATKLIDTFKLKQKTYEATMTLGAWSDTQDLTGTLQSVESTDWESLTTSHIADVISSFVGTIEQIPPMYSAKKIQGKKLYELAREGKTIARPPCSVTIHAIELLEIDLNTRTISVRVTCGPGTYIRTLCHDIGARLGTGAYCSMLRRTMIGEFDVQNAIGPKEFERASWEERLLPVE